MLWGQPQLVTRKTWCVSIPAPSPLRGIHSEACVQHHIPRFLGGTDPRVPTDVACFVAGPHLCPSLSHFALPPTLSSSPQMHPAHSCPWAFAQIIPPLRSLSQGLLLGELELIAGTSFTPNPVSKSYQFVFQHTSQIPFSASQPPPGPSHNISAWALQ